MSEVLLFIAIRITCL